MRAFERAFADYHDVPHCVSAGSGTEAILLGLRALGVRAGDEVLTGATTTAQAITAIEAIGAVPVIVDVHPGDYLMAVEQVAGALTPRTRCLLAVHAYGQCVDMAALRDVATAHGLTILEDCAQAWSARHHGRLAGTMGDAAAFSVYPGRLLGRYGDRGAVITASDEVRDRLVRLRYHGNRERYQAIRTPGYQRLLDEEEGAALRRRLSGAGSLLAARRAVAERYAEGLAGTDLGLPATAPGNEHTFHVYAVRHPRRERLLKALEAFPVSRVDVFGARDRDLPVTGKLAEELFALPVSASLPDDAQGRLIAALRDAIDSTADGA
ncbi:DegT/DnrJ/EryC1/StrS family aminotransferase [Phytohabitans houttuyneae]|uniref:UDP-2-acetamido-2-deoxy-alpha-D-ribo-hexopyranos-3-ulose 3-aminotransferase n=1 Tax=Phytohabitans houttuyneae TaxID=1076126 RepID=A0A6V8KU61_9ACTN|nr:DegT/DnrJ/EryC1/StrS family aminotransferase [Phytohabitans houttuyneae]GFJ85357.1 UDP-2-acetamido-2-deoxy-alpha-D-ribo-hexopyranos- 3-ulose 3-aminotransferase [Phytohabitans houttuyneae]